MHKSCSQVIPHFNCTYNSDWFCKGKVPDEKYQLPILVSHYLNLHQHAKALLKTSNEKMVTLYSLVLPSVGIQSCRLRAAYFHVNVLSVFPYSPYFCKALTERWGWSPSQIIPSQSKPKQNLQPPLGPNIKYVWFAQPYSTSAISEGNFFPLLLTMFLNKKRFTFEFEMLR